MLTNLVTHGNNFGYYSISVNLKRVLDKPKVTT